MCRDGFFAPERDLQRRDRFGRATTTKIEPAQQQVRLRQIRRQIQRPSKFLDGLAIGLTLEGTPARVEMKRREVLLIALPCRGDEAVDFGAGLRQLFMQTLEAFRNRIATARRFLPSAVLR